MFKRISRPLETAGISWSVQFVTGRYSVSADAVGAAIDYQRSLTLENRLWGNTVYPVSSRAPWMGPWDQQKQELWLLCGMAQCFLYTDECTSTSQSAAHSTLAPSALGNEVCM